MDFEAIKNAMTRGGSGSHVMAKVVVSSYWRDEVMSLSDLNKLDENNFKLALKIIGYRRMQGWDDEAFWALAKEAKALI